MRYNVSVSDLACEQYDKFLEYIYFTLLNSQAADSLMQDFENEIGQCYNRKRVIPQHVKNALKSLFIIGCYYFLFHIPLTAVKSQVECVEVLGVKVVLHDAEGFTKISNLSKCLQTQCLSGLRMF